MRALAAACVLLLMTAPVRACDGYVLDAEASRVRFQLHALGWWPVRGEARAEGAVTREDERLRIDVRVPLVGLRMGREGYRDWALSPEFFWAARHPELTFRADALAPADLRAGGEIRGELQEPESSGSGLASGSDVVLDSQGRALVAAAVTQNGMLRGYVFGRRINEFEGQIVLEHWFPGVGPSEGLGFDRDAFDRIFPVGYITVNGGTEARVTRIHG